MRKVRGMAVKKTDKSKRMWKARERWLRLRDWLSTPTSRQGTRQRKVRWGRRHQSAVSQSKRVTKDRVKRRMTRQLQRSRMAKGGNHRTG